MNLSQIIKKLTERGARIRRRSNLAREEERLPTVFALTLRTLAPNYTAVSMTTVYRGLLSSAFLLPFLFSSLNLFCISSTIKLNVTPYQIITESLRSDKCSRRR